MGLYWVQLYGACHGLACIVSADAAAEAVHVDDHSVTFLPARVVELANSLARVMDPAAGHPAPRPNPSRERSQRAAAATWRAWHAGLADEVRAAPTPPGV